MLTIGRFLPWKTVSSHFKHAKDKWVTTNIIDENIDSLRSVKDKTRQKKHAVE